MEQTWRVYTAPAENFPHRGERELALALVNGADAYFGRLFGRPHKSVNDFLLVRVEMPVIIDLRELSIPISRVEYGATHPTAMKLHGKSLPYGS